MCANWLIDWLLKVQQAIFQSYSGWEKLQTKNQKEGTLGWVNMGLTRELVFLSLPTGVILVSLENASFHMVHVYTINWFKKCRILITVLTLNNRPSSYRTRRGRTDEQRYAIISPYFDGRIKMNGPYPEITNISFLAKLFFKTFISFRQHLSDYRTVGLSDRQTIGLSDYWTVGL
jgi:hypothetical protein